MERDDVQLIQDILSGDDEAFNILVEKYQKSVHALAWRKVGDFHYAEEITQDTFLQAYKKLPTLKNPSLFAGWLYVTANRLCLNWMRKQKPAMQSLEATSKKEIEALAYTHYVSEQLEIEATECRYESVKKLLEELPESERTVVTLYYLGEMTMAEIGKFLGVSTNTIKSRLRRARKRLQEKEELLIHEVLGSIQLPANLTKHIMQRVADLKLTPPPTGKPLLPWATLGAATVFVMLLLGASNQHLIRFQKPYSFDSASEPSIEIIDTLIVLDTNSKPAIRNQIGRVASADESGSTGSQRTETDSTSDAQRNLHKLSTAPWTQANGPQGSPTYEIFATSRDTLYVSTQTGIYKLPTDTTAWTRIKTNIRTRGGKMYMAEHSGILYIVSTDEIFASTDNGETWNAFCPIPKGRPVGFIVTDETEGMGSQADITMYLAFKDQGVFRSIDAGVHWDLLNDGLSNKRIYAVAAIENIVFSGTNKGLYRLNSGTWEQVSIEDASNTTQPFGNEAFADTDSGLYRLNSGVWEQVPVEAFNAIHSLEVFENNLYVAMGPDLSTWRTLQTTYGIVVDARSLHGRIFHSTDLGESWTEITPKNEPIYFSISNRVEFSVAGETFLARGAERFRSTDAGQTWSKLGTDPNMPLFGIWDNEAVNEKTFYAVGIYGIYRTTDAGDSWHLFMDGIIGTRTQQLVALNDKFYTHTGRNFAESTDGGESWKSVQIHSKLSEKEQSRFNLSPDAKLAVADGNLYGLTTQKENLRIFCLSMDTNALVPVQGMPTLDYEMLPTELRTTLIEAKGTYSADNTVKDPKLTKALHQATTHANTGGFTVSDGTFYVEYQRGLFKWKPGDSEWIHTGLIETDNTHVRGYESGFKVAVSADTVYVGMRDGKLFQSLDAGNSWKDITPTLPLRFEDLNEIIFVGSTVYVATDTGVLASQNGEYWRVLTDSAGERTVIDRLAVDYDSVYGAGDTGVYRLDTRGKWEQISSNVPSKVASLVVNNNKLYISTERIGMFHIPLTDVSTSNRKSL